MKINISLMITILLFVSTQLFAKTELIKCGTEWINIHKGNSDLTGVYVQQSPDNVEDEADYIGKHPAMIVYVFKNDRAHIVTYTPIGQVQDGVWSNIPQDDWMKKMVTKDLKLDKQCAYWVERPVKAVNP